MKLPWPVSKTMLMSTVTVVLIVGLLDFALRVFVDRGGGERPYVAPKALPVAAQYDGKAASVRLESWFPKAVVQEELKERAFALRGVFRSGGASRAMVWIEPRGEDPARYVVVNRGDDIEGWRVETIEARKIKLVKGEQTRELEIFRKQQGASAP